MSKMQLLNVWRRFVAKLRSAPPLTVDEQRAIMLKELEAAEQRIQRTRNSRTLHVHLHTPVSTCPIPLTTTT